VRPAGGNHATLKKYAALWAIPTDHFGFDHRPPTREPIPLADVLVEGSTYQRGALKRRLFAEGLKERRCELCGARFYAKYAKQRFCSRRCGVRHNAPRLRLVERPPHEQLLAELAASSYLAVGRKYGVSDNAIRKWVRAYERERAALASAA
jgi:hypothetical protein